MSTATKFAGACFAVCLAFTPWGGVLAQTGDDDDSARHSTDTTGHSDPAPDDDDSSDTSTGTPVETAQSPSPEAKTEVCDDDIDNDGDDLIDCADLNDCASFPTCGQIQGGWGWVISAYGLSFAALLAYTLMVTLRLRALQQREKS
jgi:hypothetical protein